MRTLPIFCRVAVVFAVTGLCFVPAASARAKETGTGGAGVSVLLATINAERLAKHERMLRLDLHLCRIAFEHAADMARNHYLDHFSLDGRSPFERMRDSHYRFGYAGENLALDVDARAAAAALWSSSEHRSNLLEPHYAHVGIAAVPSGGEVIVVEDFSD